MNFSIDRWLVNGLTVDHIWINRRKVDEWWTISSMAYQQINEHDRSVVDNNTYHAFQSLFSLHIGVPAILTIAWAITNGLLNKDK